MKKKLLFWEAVMTLISLGLFLIVFSIQSGWGLVGPERYRVAAEGITVVLIAAVVITIIVPAGSILATVVAGVAASVGAGIAVIVGIAGIGAAAIVAGIAAAGIVVVGVAGIGAAAGGVAADSNELKNSFAIISLIAEGLVIFGIISAITFLF